MSRTEAARKNSSLDFFGDTQVEVDFAWGAARAKDCFKPWPLNQDRRSCVRLIHGVHFRTGFQRTSFCPDKRGTGPRFWSACHIVPNRLTFPESQRPTKQFGFLVGRIPITIPETNTMRVSRADLLLLERVGALLRT
jgi:hypothetical protein